MTAPTITIDGKPVLGVVSIAITTSAAPVLRVAPGGLAAAAQAAPAGATILLAPGRYAEAVAFDRAITIQSADWTPGRPPPAAGAPPLTVTIDATGLALPEDKAALLFRAPATIRGIEVTGAVSSAGNGAGIRNELGIDLTIEDCDLHGSENGIMVSGGTLVLNRVSSHHNIGDANCHPLYASANAGTVVATDCRFYHTPHGNDFKSRALETTLTRCWFGDISVPGDMPGVTSWLPYGTSPPPFDSTAAAPRIWLGRHPGCNCDGASEAGKCIDVPDGGKLTVTECVLVKADAESGFVVGYCFETAKNGAVDTLLDRCRIYKYCLVYIGNRGPGSAMELRDCQVTGDDVAIGYRWGAKPMIHDIGTGLKPPPVIRFAGSTPAGG